jgi:hypothetical protein
LDGIRIAIPSAASLNGYLQIKAPAMRDLLFCSAICLPVITGVNGILDNLREHEVNALCQQLCNFYVSEGSIIVIDDMDELWWTRNHLNFIVARYFRAPESRLPMVNYHRRGHCRCCLASPSSVRPCESEEGMISACGRHVETT